MECMGGPWSAIEAVGNGVQVSLGVHRQVGALGQILAQQSVGVLAGAALPGAVGVTEVHAHAGVGGELGMAGHLSTLVVRHALAQWRSNRPQLGRQASQGRGGRGIGHLDEQQQTAGTLDQHAHGGFVASPLDEVALPVSRHQAVFNLGRAHMDADHLGNLAAAVGATRARHALAVAVAQTGHQLPSQLPAGMGIDGGVDGLMRDLQLGALGIHPQQCASNLLGRILPVQQGSDHAPEDAVPVQLGRRACGIPARRTALLRRCGRIGPRVLAIAAKLPTDGRGRTPQCSGHGPNTAPLLHQTGHRHALFRLKLSVRRRPLHRNTLQAWGVDRGRDARYRPPPAQIRTGPIRAYGSYLGCLTAKRC